MNPIARERLFDASHAFDHPVVFGVTAVVVAILAVTPVLIFALSKMGKVDEKLRGELYLRYYSWLVLTPLILVPILLGAFWTILGIAVLSLLCYREYARATGLFREKTISLAVTLGIVAVFLTAFDNWYRLFVALTPFTVGIIAITAILRDEPKGYIQRVGLGVLGFALFGSCLGHLGAFANDANYRAILVWIFLCVELNDVFAFISGKTFGRHKLAPNTSPKKTVEGAAGAVLLTTCVVVAVGWFVFADTDLDHPIHLVALGVLISVLGQMGDLMLSSIKRDLGIKDMAASIPGHGGLLDRFDSVILVGPAVFHYVNYFVGVGVDQPARIWTGG